MQTLWETKKIVMLQTELGSDCEADGRSHGARMYLKGEEYIVGQRLAHDFCERMGVAKYLGAQGAHRATKNAGKAPENK